MNYHDWKSEQNPVRRMAKRLLSGDPLTDGRPLSDLIELNERTRKQLAFEATLTDQQIEMLQELGEISETCSYWGIPLLAMMYPRGQKVENEHDVELVKHAARVGSELGVDIVKTNYTGDPDSFKEVVEGALVPVVIAGGPKVDTDEELLQMVKDSIEVGGAGVAFGRNLFQAENPGKITKAISEVVHNDLEVNEALKFLK